MAAVREHARAASELAAQLARDKKFRKQLSGAAKHGSRAKQRVVGQIGSLSLARRLATDAELRAELQQMTDDLQAAWERLQSKRTRSHGLRNTLLLAGLGGGLALALRKRRTSKPSFSGGTTPRVIESSIEVDVPVSAAYNQWTQFEEFPQFMEGVEHVRAAGRHAPALGRVGRRPSRRVGREDPRAASRPADQLDQRGRQEDARHGHVRAARRRADARPAVARATRRRARRGASAPRSVSTAGGSKAISSGSRS